jgi:hypothetical protein
MLLSQNDIRLEKYNEYEYRNKAGKLDAEYHQPGDSTTFKSILNEYGRGW